MRPSTSLRVTIEFGCNKSEQKILALAIKIIIADNQLPLTLVNGNGEKSNNEN
jgi:hypothetical protein